MTVSIRNPMIKTRYAPVRTAAQPTPAKAIERIRPDRDVQYKYALTSIDVLFTALSEPADAKTDQMRADRRTGVLVLAGGMIVVMVGTVAVALLIHMLLQLGSAALA